MKFPSSYMNHGISTKERQKVQASQVRKAPPKRQVYIPGAAGIDESLETNSVDNVHHSVEVQDAEKDQTLLQKLDYETWLPFAAKTYNISPKIEDYLIVNTIVCPSDIPNRNGIAFPRSELAQFLPPPTNRMAYKAWKGCPVHLEHQNEVHEDAYGVILDASFHKIIGYGNGQLWKVMGLLAIDKNKYPDIAQEVLKGLINTYSMGALVDSFSCGFCGAECSKEHICPHITSHKNVNWKVFDGYDGQEHLAFLNAHGIQPIECSIVRDPAWAPALSDQVFEFAPSERVEIVPDSPINRKNDYYPFDN